MRHPSCPCGPAARKPSPGRMFKESERWRRNFKKKKKSRYNSTETLCDGPRLKSARYTHSRWTPPAQCRGDECRPLHRPSHPQTGLTVSGPDLDKDIYVPETGPLHSGGNAWQKNDTPRLVARKDSGPPGNGRANVFFDEFVQTDKMDI